jgi:hypothetical protein
MPIIKAEVVISLNNSFLCCVLQLFKRFFKTNIEFLSWRLIHGVLSNFHRLFAQVDADFTDCVAENDIVDFYFEVFVEVFTSFLRSWLGRS